MHVRYSYLQQQFANPEPIFEGIRELLKTGAFTLGPQVDEFEGRDRSIGASLDAYCDEHSPDLLVMGAYGTSRVKEFLLGGATEHILNAGRVATFLSH